jgi:predicted ATPase
VLDAICLHNFKAFLDARLELRRLTLLSGLNGMGKSTIIQALLLLRQSFEANALTQGRLLLNGPLLQMGMGADVLAEHADEETVGFDLHWADGPASELRFAYAAASDYLQQSNASIPAEELSRHSLFRKRFQHIGADRLGPRAAYPLSEYYVESLESLGTRGEFTVHFIAKHREKPLAVQALRHPEAVSGGLGDNLDAWMSAFSPGLRISARVIAPLNAASLSFQFVQGRELTREFKPQNVGFGLSYALPVVTALLAASPGDLVVLENPESHLHPAGQSQLGRLCAIAAQNGVQLIVESHSDHFLNGIRVAARGLDIDAHHVRLYFFERQMDAEKHAVQIGSPELDQKGRIDRWPPGFFDEWERQLEALL